MPQGLFQAALRVLTSRWQGIPVEAIPTTKDRLPVQLKCRANARPPIVAHWRKCKSRTASEDNIIEVKILAEVARNTIGSGGVSRRVASGTRSWCVKRGTIGNTRGHLCRAAEGRHGCRTDNPLLVEQVERVPEAPIGGLGLCEGVQPQTKS